MIRSDSKLVLSSITDLLSESFYIPSYQRGYRWPKKQVQNLLDDIWSFRINSQNESQESFYCLQPIVVSRKEDEWEVLDGQQRLTTINIILQYLKSGLEFLGKQNFRIRYQTRPDSETFLAKIDLDKKENNIDYFHICDAFEAVAEWFDNKDGNSKIHFLTTLLNDEESGKNVKVIWYDVSEENTSENYAIDIFTRLNIGKIPLTNAELVKALFLQKGNFSDNETSFKQLQIASEWDAIEKALQNEAFWFFIYNPSNPLKYDNRIEYIFDLMKGKTKEKEDYYTFNEFNKDFEKSKSQVNKPDIDTIWLKIKKYFSSLEEWYNNKKYYHMVGFLIECGIDIDHIKNLSKEGTKSDFEKNLIREIKSQVKCQIDELNYGDKRIKKVLLLFNIQTILATKAADIRFPFFRYKNEKWDIEHVRSQTDKEINKGNRKDWAVDVLEYFTGLRASSSTDEKNYQEVEIEKLSSDEKDSKKSEQELAKRLLNIICSENIKDDDFKKIYKDVEIYFKEDNEFEDKDSIGNLTLLDAKTNRSYGNAMFPIKRKTVIHNDMNGVFVPIATKNVFLKSYTKKLGDIMHWTIEDAEDYSNSIKKTLINFLPNQEDKHDDE